MQPVRGARRFGALAWIGSLWVVVAPGTAAAWAQAPEDRAALPIAPALTAPAPVGGGRPPIRPGGGPAVAGLGLADLERMALEHNPTLTQARGQIEESRGRAIQAGLPPNPEVGFRMDVVGSKGTAGRQGGMIQQRIITGGKLRLNRDRFEIEIQQSRELLRLQELRVLNEVRRRYVRLLALQARQQARRELVSLADEAVGVVRRKVATGDSSEADLLTAVNHAREQRFELIALAGKSRNAWAELAGAIGRPDLIPAPLVGDLERLGPPLTWEDAWAALERHNPDLGVTRLRIRRQEVLLRYEEVQPIPDLTLMASPQYQFTTDNLIVNATATLNIPLWDRNQGNIRTARGSLIDVNRDYQRQLLSYGRRLSGAFALYQTGLELVPAYRDQVLPDARRAARLYLDSYREGDGSYSRVETALGNLAQATDRYLDNLLDLHEATVSIRGLMVADDALTEPREVSTLGNPSRPPRP